MPNKSWALAAQKRESRPAVAERLPECLLASDTQGHSKKPALLQFHILVRPEVFGRGFDVVVEPTMPDRDVGRELPDYPLAMAFARVLRLEFGFPIVDRTGERS